MIRRLRFKFVLVNMGIVTLMLCVIFGLVFYFTSANLERESTRMMESIAEQPFQLSAPSEMGEDVRLPFFALQLGPRGELVATGGGYYDLSDDAFLHRLIDAAYASPRNLGVLEEYNLRYYLSGLRGHLQRAGHLGRTDSDLPADRRVQLPVVPVDQRPALQVGGASGGRGPGTAAAVCGLRLP